MSAIINWFNHRFSRHLIDEAIAYNSHSTLDVYAPNAQGTSPRRVIILWYGGSWSHGDKSLYRFVAHNLVRSTGSVVIIPDYQLYPDVTYPYFIDEAWEVVKWACEHADQYNATMENYSVVGHSSGAHTACSIALGFHRPTSLPLPAKCVSLAGPNYIVEKPFWPVFDIKTYDYSRFPNHFATLDEASKDVRFLVVHGKLDRVVDQRQSLIFHETLVKNKFQANLLRPIIGHPSLIISLGSPFAAISRPARNIIRFLKT